MTPTGRIFCPQCGYDLFGIPEDRCPECGFGYQRAAIRNLADDYAARMLVVSRRVVTAALWAWVPALGRVLGQWARADPNSDAPEISFLLLVVLGCALPQVCGLYLRRRGFEAPGWRYAVVSVAGLLVLIAGIIAYEPAVLLSSVCTLLAWVLLIVGHCSVPYPAPYLGSSLDHELRVRTSRSRRRMWLALAAAHVAPLAAWL